MKNYDLEIQKVINDIKSLKIQGNTNIAKASVKAILDYLTHSKADSFGELVSKVKHYALELANARPNEPLTYNAIHFILDGIENSETQQQSRVKIIDRIQIFFNYINDSFEVIRQNAFNILKQHNIFLTHCHSSLVRDSIIRISEVKSNLTVISTETRPLFQGRITSTKLADKGIQVIHVVDSAVASMILDPRYINPEVVVVGCDGITIEGDLINKVGTLNIALAAKSAKIPFYVVAQSMKIDLRYLSKDTFVNIESRSPEEVWNISHKKIKILNPAFDFVPAKYITGYITEKGLIEPKSIKNLVKQS